ncbi:unnamed protein product [Angiostrongylus costaricensis]|uniref:Uncharacterized protein n=1 Tax=Angiostrongylus costaricensis TaxID=334426 RepID=A0A158PDM6_ANGCS|nr:unnamed protein product [Angiostrongylus costaricensis]
MIIVKRLRGVEEFLWDHNQMSANILYKSYLVFCAICLSLAAWTAGLEQELHNNNFVDILEPLMRARSKVTNGTLYLSEVIYSLYPEHPLHNLYNKTRLRYDYGTTYYNYCEMLLCLVQGKAVYILTTRGQVVQFFTRLLPCLQILSTCILMLIFCLQQDQDKQMKWMMYYDIPSFCILFVAHGFLYSFLQILKTKTKVQIILFCLRSIDLTVFSILTPSVYSSYNSYLEFKPCHTHVSISAAVTEYTWMCLIALFYVSQINDYKCFTLNLTVTENDTIPREDLFNYYPAFMTAAFDNAPFANLRPRRQLRWRPPSTLGLPKTSQRCLSKKRLML